MAAPRISFFPPKDRITVSAPNGNGKTAAPPIDAKGLSFTGPGWARGDFWPTSSGGATTLDYAAGVAGLGWYRAAWLIYACMAHRAEKLSQPPLWIREEEGNEEVWIKGDHPLAAILTRPNPDTRMRGFLERVSLFLDGTGRCCIVKVRDNAGRAAALRPFSARDVLETASDGERFFGRFKIRTAAKPEGEWFEAADVIHLYNEDPDDPREVIAPLDVAAEAAGIGRVLAESIRAGLRNSVVPGFVVTIPADATKDQKDEVRAGYAENYESARRHGRTLVLSGGATGARQKLGFAGLEGGKLADEQEIAICACFRTPPVVIGAHVGLENSSDRHNLETSRELFYENAIEPIWRRIEEALTDDLLAEVDKNPLRYVRFDTSRVRAYQVDRDTQSQVSERTADVLLVNERRALMQYPPLTPEELAELKASHAGLNISVAAPAPDPAKGARGHEVKADGDALRWAVHDAVLQAQEFGWELAAMEALQEDRAAVLRMAADTLREDAGKGTKSVVANTLRDLLILVAAYFTAEAITRWLAKITPLTSATSRRAVERLAAEVGISFDLLQPGLLTFVEAHSAELVTQVTTTTKEAIRAALADGLVEGEGIPALTKRIREATAFGRERATLIARTETVAATNGAQVHAMSQYAAESGGTVKKRWLSANDGRVRPAHRAMNGETRGIDEAFSNGLQHPSEPRCRCAVVFQLEEEAA